MPSIDDIYGGENQNLKVDDFLKDGKPKGNLKLTISGTEVVGFKKKDEHGNDIGEERKVKVIFTEIDKGLILNKTNAEAISDIAGSKNLDRWEGSKVELFPTKVEYRGNLVWGVRVRPIGGWEALGATAANSDDGEASGSAHDDLPF